MSWLEDLRRVRMSDGRTLIGASFRGVPFFVESSERSGGRRTAVHEFPFRDDPFGEDLGRRARKFSIDGYVIGDTYLVQRDALIAALEDVGNTGELVHPYHGVRRVMCPNFRVRESKLEGGIAMFAIEFDETPTQVPAPTEVVDGADRVSSGSKVALASSRAELVSSYSSKRMPSYAMASAVTALKNATEEFRSKVAPIVTSTQELAAMRAQADLLIAQASSLVRTPDALFDGFAGALSGLVETAASAPGALMGVLFEVYLADLGSPVVATTATRERELANQTALTSALRRIVAIEAARLAPLVAYESIEKAIEARDEVSDLLEQQAGLATDTAYPAIVDLRSQVLRAVPGSSSLARETTVARRVSIPSIVLAYKLYGDTASELDIVARNGVKHPGFMYGDLKVLSSG